jgi:hypothetical protein
VTWLLVVMVVAVAVIAAGLWGEFEHWRSSRRRMGSRPGGAGTGEAVLVLGYRSGELTALKPVMAAIGRRHLRSAVRAAAVSGTAGTAAAADTAQTTLS